MTIYNPQGNVIFEAPVTKEAIIKYVLMEDYYIELPFYSNKLRKFPRGSYILHKGRKFEIMSVVRPEYQKNTGGYKYTLKFEAQQSHMKRRKVFWLKGTNAETSFHDTTFLADFGQLIADNMNRFLGGESWKVAAVPNDLAEAAKLVSFNGDFCWDALNRIAETFECEWWTVDNGTEVWIYFGKLEFGTPELFERGKVVTSIPAKKGDDSNYGTRFYIFGSTRNLPDDYDPTEQGGPTNHVSEKRLHLPNRMQYIDAWDNIEQADIIEQVAFFDDIFPKNTETVTSVTTIPRKVENTDDLNATFDAYVMYCANTPFLPSDVYESETLTCKFTSGSLNGREFELAIIDNNNDNIDPAKWKPEDGFNKKFEIIADVEQIGEDNVLTIPNESLHPKAGDTFVLTGVRLPKERITEAENELLEVGKIWAKKNSSDTDVYDCPTNAVYCQLNNKNYEPGQKVVLIDDRFGNTGRQSRIQGFEKKLWNEYEATYTVGDNASYSRLGSIETNISESAYAERIGVVSGVGIYLIRSKYDTTQPTDYNAYSALATEALFLNKRKGGIVAGDVAFGGEIITTDFRAGLIGGAGLGIYKDDNGNTVLEADRLNVRQEMQVNTIVINQAEGRGGMEIDTAAFMEVTRVDDTTDGYVCYFDQKDGSVANLFHVDDVAFCNRWTPENTDLKFYKRRVTAVGIDNITLSKTDVNGTGIPTEKDNIIHFGNYTDKTRQYVKVRDVVGGGYERYLDGLDSVNAQGNEYYFVGKQNGLYDEKPRWFIGDKNGEYAEWVDGKLNIKGAISVQSTIGGDKIDKYIKKVSPPVEQEDIESFVNNIVDPKIEGIQNQIDGVIETWFYNGVPTLTNYPANGWNTDALKVQHLGDLYYDNDTGTAYRFSQNSQGGYYWNTITDDAITKALAAAKAAQDTADGKRRIFTSRPTPPYDKGDLWVNAIYGSQYNDDILRCDTAKASGAAFVISDWVLSSKYTDDTLAQAAKEAAHAAQTTANEAKSVAEAAKTRLDSWAADGVISPTEKQGIKDEIARIDSDKAHIMAEYTRYDLGTSTEYNNAHSTYRAQLVALSASTPENIAIPSTFAANQTAYYNQRTVALGIIADAAKKYADAVAKKEADEAVKGYKYLKEALADVTTIAGGLMLSSQIRLGSHNADFTTQTTWSGMNGIYTKPRDIASWYGGDMLDLFNDDDTRKALAANDRPAASLIRMDGSAYFAKGNIGFRSDGSGWLGNDLTGIKFSNTGVMTFGSGISFDVSNVSGLDNTLATLAQFNASLTTLLSPCDANDNEISWAEATMSDNAGGIKAKSLKSKVGIWSEKFVSSKGPGNGGTDDGMVGATALTQLSDVSLATPILGDVLQFNGQKWTNVAMSTLRPDLTGYATQQWVKDQGYLTSHQSLAGYVTLNTAQTINSTKTFIGDQYVRMRADTSNAVGIVWKKTDGTTNIASITYHNTAQNIILNPIGSTATYDDAVGKYSLVVGNNKLTYNTYPILHTGNYSNTLDNRYVTLGTTQTITAAKTFAAIVYRKTNTLVRTVFNSDTGQDYLIFGDTAGYTYLRGDTIGFQNSLGKTNVTIANDGVLTAVKLAKSGGTASQILMADGSVKALSDITSAYVTALGTSGNDLTWTKNGVTGNITVPYATTAAYAGAVRDPEHYTISTRRGSANINFNNDAGLRHFLATTNMVIGKPMNDSHIIHMEWDNSLSWASQIAVPNSPSASMQWRAQNGTAWGDWTTLLDTDNYTKYVARRSSDGAVDLNTMNGVGFLSNDTTANATAARHYPIQEAGLLIYGNAAYSSANQIYGSYNSNRWFARGGGASTTGKTAWREFAFLDSNVASASKLANDAAFTAWGQTFFQNGVPRSISGDMTGVGSISFANGASAANIDTYGNFKIGTSGVRWTVRNSNNICGLCVLNSNGYVGINTEFPSQMLHVDGNVLVSGEAYYRTEGRAGNSWNNGYGALSVGIYDNDKQTPLLVAYRYNDFDWTTPHANRLFAMELLNSGSVLRFGFGGAAKFYFEKDGTFHTENGLWATQYVSSKGASASSDVRLKCALEPLTLTLEQIAEAPAVRYRWRDTGEVDLGSTSQYWLRILPEGVRIQPNGYYGMAYDKISLVAAVIIARKSLDHERRIATLERENRELKKRLNQLKAA